MSRLPQEQLKGVEPSLCAVGFSKFVLHPVVQPKSWRAELEALSAAVGDLQT